MTDPTIDALDLRAKLVHIDRMLADIDRTLAGRDRKHQEIRFAPWQLVVTGIASGAALFRGRRVFQVVAMSGQWREEQK